MMNRLALALLALAWIGASPLSAIATPGSLGSPKWLNPPIGSSDNTADTTANSQNRLSHVANVAAVAGWANLGQPVEVDGYLTPGDGGRHRMVYDSGNACGAGGHPAADPLGVICVNSTVGSGSWNIDLYSVGSGNQVPIALWGSTGKGVQAVDTAALKAALNTGYDVILQAGTYQILAGATPAAAPTYKKSGQGIFGPTSGLTYLACSLPSSPGTTNPCLNTNGLNGVRWGGLTMYYQGVPDTTSTTDKTQFGPLIYAQNTTGMRSFDTNLTLAYVDIDMRGNSGASTFMDEKFACFAPAGTGCHQVDGSLGTNDWDNPQGFPSLMTTNQATVFYAQEVGWDFGRMDQFIFNGGLNIGYLAFNFHNNVQTTYPGGAFGGISNFDCDTNACMNVTNATVQATNLISTTGGAGTYAITAGSGAVISLSSPYLVIANGTGNLVTVNSGANVGISGGVVQYLGTTANQYDTTAIKANGGVTTVVGTQFLRTPGTSSNPACTANPVINQTSNTARVSVAMAQMQDLGTVSSGCAASSNQFIAAGYDQFQRIIGNVAPGWNNTYPSTQQYGVYQFN